MSRSGPKVRTAWLLALGLLVLSLALYLGSPGEEPVQSGDLQPPGRWHLQTSRLADETGDEELARVLSLPYMAGGKEAPSAVGVLRYDEGRALPGLNLYVSGHGPEAVLMDMAGRPLHRWRYPFEAAFPEIEPTLDTAYLRRAHLFPNGDLLAIYQGGGMIKLDRDSRLLWSTAMPFYNHLYVEDSGRILSIAKTARMVPEIRPEAAILEDSIVELSADGRPQSRLSLLDCFAASPLAETIHPLPDHADIFHTNTVLPVPDPVSAGSSIFAPGQWVVSLREIDTVALVDPRERTVSAAWRGPWRAQHQPVPLHSGKLLLFDNQGAESGSRAVEFDPVTGELTWVFPADTGELLDSREAGSVQRLANGNTLITDSESGRAVEVTLEGEVVWEFSSPHRAGERLELVATLFDVRRYPPDWLTFVAEPIAD